MAQPALRKLDQPSLGSGIKDRVWARRLRGFGPVGILAILVILVGSILPIVPGLRGCLVVLWAWLSRTPWAEIGYVRPKSWTRPILGGLVLGAAFKLAMKSIVMPLLGAPATNFAYHFLVASRAALPAIVFTMIVGAGWGEETFFRGYAFERLGKLFGSTVAAKSAIVLITSCVFAMAHYPDQGLVGAEQAAITGAVFGTVFAATGRLFAVMIAHSAFDLVAVALIFFNWESNVAHWLFR